MAQTRPATSDAVLLCSHLPDAAALSRLTDSLRPLGLVPERASSDGQFRLYSGADRHLQLKLEPLPMAAECFPPGSFARGANGVLLGCHQAHIRFTSGAGPAPGAPCEDDDASPAPFELLQISYRAARALASGNGTRALCWMHSGVMLNLDALQRLSDCSAARTAPPWSLLARPQALSGGRVRMQGARQVLGCDIDLLTGSHAPEDIAETGLRALQIFAGSRTPPRDALAPASWGRNARGTLIVRLPALAPLPAPKTLTAAPGLAAMNDIATVATPPDPAQDPVPPDTAAPAKNARPQPPHARQQQLPPMPDPDQRQAWTGATTRTRAQTLPHLRCPSGDPETDLARALYAGDSCQRRPVSPRPDALTDADAATRPGRHPGLQPGTATLIATLIAAPGRPADAPAASPPQRQFTVAPKPGSGAGYGAGFASGARSGLGSGVIIAVALGLALSLLSPTSEQLTATRPVATHPPQR